MRFSVIITEGNKATEEALVLPLFEGKGAFAFVKDKRLQKELERACNERGFKGKPQEMLWHYREKSPRVVLCAGRGKKETFSAAAWFRGCAGACRELAKSQHRSGTILVAPDILEGISPEKLGEIAAEGTLYGAYEFSRYKKLEKHYGVQALAFALPQKHAAAFSMGLRKGTVIGRTVNGARELGNTPANDMTPSHLAEAARELGALKNTAVTIIDKKDFKKTGLTALWGVSRGSHEDAKFIVMEYRGGDAKEKPVCFIGKGITFDSGGISMKPSEKMDEMKFDMAGGAAVIGIMEAAARLRIHRNIVGIVPATENVPGGESYKPGDVLRAYDGTTIEVLNTDAEGRIVLADALAYAKNLKPETVIDLATLTGACVVALGSAASGLFTDDKDLAEALLAAGTETGERLWQLPLFEEYAEQVKSTIADVQNIGKRKGEAGASTGAAFLQHFARSYRWAHIDMGGTAWTTEDGPWCAKGATGVGVRLALAFLEKYAI